MIKKIKKPEFTLAEIESLKVLINDGNIALYREGKIRLRDKNHSPVANVSKAVFDRLLPMLYKSEAGLYFLKEEEKEKIPKHLIK